MLTNPQTQPTQALAVQEPAGPATVEQRPTTALGKWQRLDAMTQMKFAEFLAGTPIVPEPYRKQPGSVYVAAEMGAALGWGPIESMQNIDVIKNVPSLSAEAMRALIKQAGHRLDVVEYTAESVRVTITRSDNLGDADITYTIEDAKQAGDYAKNPQYKTRPKRMLLARATTDAARTACPEVLRGMSVAVEGDTVERFEASPVDALAATTEAVAAIDAPTPAPEPPKQASKPAKAPQAADEPEDAELVPDEPETAEEPTQATILDTANASEDDPLTADEWKQLLRNRGLTLSDVAPAAKDVLDLQSVNYSLLGKLEGVSCARLREALPNGNGEAFA